MKLTFRFKGGPGSGHHGHQGRPGKRGGSLPGGGGGGGTESDSIYHKLSGTPAEKAEKVLNLGYGHKVRQFNATLDEIHRIGDVPIMVALDKQWLQILNSPAAQLPGEAIISKLQSKGYGSKLQVHVESRKKYGS